jgi:large subunit ribosomal protein L24e
VQYNRDLYVQTVQAMKRIADIKQRREDRFWENRMKLARVQKQQDIEREVLVHGDLLTDKEKKQELVERIQEREVERKEVKEQLRQKHKGTIRI